LQNHIDFCFDKIYNNLLIDIDNDIIEIYEKHRKEKEELEATVKLLMKKNVSLSELCSSCMKFDITSEF